MTGTVIMPRELTAENGAKAAMMGEFMESISVSCLSCHGEEPECEHCDGSGEISYDVPVSWTNIKEIYARAVELLGK